MIEVLLNPCLSKYYILKVDLLPMSVINTVIAYLYSGQLNMFLTCCVVPCTPAHVYVLLVNLGTCARGGCQILLPQTRFLKDLLTWLVLL